MLLGRGCIAVLLFDIGAFSHPAGPGVAAAGRNPAELIAPGVGAVFAFGIAAFIGFESGSIYSEECRDPRRTVGRATFVALAFTGISYAVSAWAMTVLRSTRPPIYAGIGQVAMAPDEHEPPLLDLPALPHHRR